MRGVPETPLLETVASPFVLKSESSAEAPLLESRVAFPMPSFTRARSNKSGRQLPQAIAHRGYKAAHPENTMGAFAGAVKAGAHAIETDIHLSRDGVVVLSHDANLKRCFGRKEKIIDCDWEFIRSVRTLRAPHESMPRLRDLLQYLSTPGLEHVWLLLDIKV
ncbi:MAG: gamma-tubulin [Candelina mexicana]|nr:MAG: gamma-tubulin [Candelina mexicana]